MPQTWQTKNDLQKAHSIFRHRQKMCYIDDGLTQHEKEDPAEKNYSHAHWATRPNRYFGNNGHVFLTEDGDGNEYSGARVGDVHAQCTPLLNQTSSIYSSALHPKYTCPHRQNRTSIIGGVQYNLSEPPGDLMPSGGDTQKLSDNTTASHNSNSGIIYNTSSHGNSDIPHNTGRPQHHVHFDPDVISDQNKHLLYSSFKTPSTEQHVKFEKETHSDDSYPLCVINPQITS